MIKERIVMYTEIEKRVQQELFALADEAYRDFQALLVPNVEKERILGVRIPILRRFAGAFAKTDDAAAFCSALPHRYYDENNLHAFLVEKIRDIDALEAALDRFLPYVDNWATCDSMNPKIFAKYPEKRLIMAKKWIASDHTYTIRYGMGILMRYDLGETFTPDILTLITSVRSEEYYVNMMQAWFLATALAKQWDATLPYLTEKRLPVWIHNKTIQKAIESYRITAEQKDFLRTLKIK